jgi:hypothetical protein
MPTKDEKIIMSKTKLVFVFGMVVLAGCVAPPKMMPVNADIRIPHDLDVHLFTKDIRECRIAGEKSAVDEFGLAEVGNATRTINPSEDAIFGAIIGALIGGHTMVPAGALAGAVEGAANGSSSSEETKAKVQAQFDWAYEQCMYAHGYQKLHVQNRDWQQAA